MTARVLLGKRPERPKDTNLTNGLWSLTQRCLEQDPRRRPDMTEVVRYLQRTLTAQRDRADSAAAAKAGNANSGSTPWRGVLHRASSFITRCGTRPTGSKGTRRSMFTYRPWKRRGLDQPLPGALLASDKARIESEESGHSFHRITLEELGTPIVMQSTSPRSRNFLQRAGSWLLKLGAPTPPTQDHHSHPDNSSGKQGTANFRGGVLGYRSNYPRTLGRSPKPNETFTISSCTDDAVPLPHPQAQPTGLQSCLGPSPTDVFFQCSFSIRTRTVRMQSSRAYLRLQLSPRPITVSTTYLWPSVPLSELHVGIHSLFLHWAWCPLTDLSTQSWVDVTSTNTN